MRHAGARSEVAGKEGAPPTAVTEQLEASEMDMETLSPRPPLARDPLLRTTQSPIPVPSSSIPSTKLSDTSPSPSLRPSDFSPATLWQEVAEGALSGHRTACEALAMLIPTVVTTLGGKADKIEGELAISESKVTRLSTYLEELAGENRKLKDALAAQDSSWESLEGKAASLEEELREARQHSQLLSTHFDAVLSYEKAIVNTVGVSFLNTSLETEGVTVATNAGFKAVN